MLVNPTDSTYPKSAPGSMLRTTVRQKRTIKNIYGMKTVNKEAMKKNIQI